MTAKNATEPPKPAPGPDALVLRHAAAVKLGEQLDMSTVMVGRCQETIQAAKNPTTEQMLAAARLMQASAQVTRSLLLAALGETRHRSFAETPSPADRQREAAREYYGNNLKAAEAREKVAQRMDEIVQQSIRARTGETQEQDRVAYILKEEAKSIAQLKKVLKEYE